MSDPIIGEGVFEGYRFEEASDTSCGCCICDLKEAGFCAACSILLDGIPAGNWKRIKASKPDGELSVEEKAKCWDKLMACERIRILGYTRGGADGKQGPISQIGLELWTEFKPIGSVSTTTEIGRDLLTEFASGKPIKEVVE